MEIKCLLDRADIHYLSFRMGLYPSSLSLSLNLLSTQVKKSLVIVTV